MEEYTSPIEILGPNKFYTDEFDAFDKYYEEICKLDNEHSAMHLLRLVDDLRLTPYCELSDRVNRLPKKMEQNQMPLDVSEINNNIAYAHSSLKLISTKEKGRHLITTTQLEKGDVIISEKATILQVTPLCSCFDEDGKMYRCHHCAYAVTKFFTCQHCNLVIYCSGECSDIAYNNYHKYECEGLQKHYWKLDETDYSYLALRMLLYGATENFNHNLQNKSKWGDIHNNYPYVYRLQSNFHKLPVKKVYTILKEAAKNILYLFSKTSFFSEFRCKDYRKFTKYLGGLFVKHYCQAQMNCVLLRYPNYDEEFAFNVIGSGGKAICPTIAMINHSCIPNAVMMPYCDRIVVRTLAPVPANTEITLAYQEIFTFFTITERRMIMKDYFYFKDMCQCSFCTYESTWQEYPYKCNNCKNGRAKKVILNNDEKKIVCKDCTTYAEIDVKAEKTVEIASNLYRATYGIEPIIRVVESYEKLYPADSWMFLDSYRLLYLKYDNSKVKPVQTIKYGLLYFKLLEKYVPGWYLPLLEAKIKFFFNVLSNEKLMGLIYAAPHDLDVIRSFIDDCLKTRRYVRYYVPDRYLDHFFDRIIDKLEEIQYNLNIDHD